jgi:antitoxin FitA
MNMPDVLVRDVDERVLTKLKARASENGRSLQNELLQVLHSVTENNGLSDEKTAEKIKNALRDRKHSDSTTLIREDRRR